MDVFSTRKHSGGCHSETEFTSCITLSFSPLRLSIVPTRIGTDKMVFVWNWMGYEPSATMRLNPFRYRSLEEIEAKERRGPSFVYLVFRSKWEDRTQREKAHVIYGFSYGIAAGLLVVPGNWGLSYLWALVFWPTRRIPIVLSCSRRHGTHLLSSLSSLR